MCVSIYYDKKEGISYWRTYDKKEVDAVIGDAKVAIEMIYVLDFFKMLWNGDIF